MVTVHPSFDSHWILGKVRCSRAYEALCRVFFMCTGVGASSLFKAVETRAEDLLQHDIPRVGTVYCQFQIWACQTPLSILTGCDSYVPKISVHALRFQEFTCKSFWGRK